MKKLLLITGDLATGKSTFGAILAQRYSTPAFFKDKVKEVLSDSIGYTNRAENKKLSVGAVEVMILNFSVFANCGEDLILEANFRGGELEKIHKIASENDYDVLTLALRADTEILYKRYWHRMNNENRHPAHLIATFDSLEGFESYIGEARGESIPGEKIYICADDFGYQSDRSLLRKIDEFMKA